MKPHTQRPTRARVRAIRFAGGATLILLGVLACEEKPASFFAPSSGSNTPGLLDLDPPIFSNPIPALGLSGPFAIPSAGFDVRDLVGANGAPASGIDWASITAKLASNGQSLPVTRTTGASQVRASLSGIADGSLGINWFASDLKGNKATASQNLYLKLNGPLINFTTTPQATWQSSAPSVQFTFNGTISDPYFGLAVGTVTRPGPDNICGNADDVAWPTGNSGGQVSGNAWTYTNSVTANGTFSAGFTAYNGVAPGGQPSVGSYCINIRAQDRATDSTGAAKPNATTRSFRSDLTWQPPSSTFALDVTSSYRHLGATSEVCASVTTTPVQANAAYQGSITGPGVSGTGQVAGNLSASGTATLRFPIVSFGTYNGSVTVLNQSATFSINVTSSAGSCPP